MLVWLSSSKNALITRQSVLRTLCFSSESAAAEWACGPYAPSESFGNEILLIKSPRYVLSSHFRQGTLELACSDFFIFFLTPSVTGTFALQAPCPGKAGPTAAGVSDGCTGLLRSFLLRSPPFPGMPLLLFQSTLRCVRRAGGSRSGHRATPWSSRSICASCKACNKECKLRGWWMEITVAEQAGKPW